MTLSDPSIPIIAATVLFVTICLLALGLLVYFKQLAYRRRLVEKLNAHDEEYGVFDDNSASLSLSETPSSSLLNFLNAIGMKFRAKDSEKAFDTKLKFLRAGYRGTNVATVFWGTKVFLAVTFPMTFLLVVAVLFQSLATKYVLL